MAGIFTRKALADVLNAESTPEEKVDAIYSLYGRAIDDGYVTKAAANAAKEDAVEKAAEKAKADALAGVEKPNVKDSDEFKTLLADFNAYKERQAARDSEDFAGVKPKFFDAVYDKIDRAEGAKPIAEQMQAIREKFEEFFNPAEEGDDKNKGAGGGKPQFGDGSSGSNPSGEKGESLADAWGYSKRFYGNAKGD